VRRIHLAEALIYRRSGPEPGMTVLPKASFGS
jgi:hypothetical protein